MNPAATSAFALEPFPELQPGEDLAGALTDVLIRTGTQLEDGDIVVVASKVVSIAEKRYVELASVTPGPEALELSTQIGKPAEIIQLILENSTEHVLATTCGPIIARHTFGYQLTSAGIDRAGADGAWLLPVDPDASACALRDALITAAAGIILGQRGRSAPAAVLRGITYTPSDDGVAAMLHQRP